MARVLVIFCNNLQAKNFKGEFAGSRGVDHTHILQIEARLAQYGNTAPKNNIEVGITIKLKPYGPSMIKFGIIYRPK